MLVADEDGGWHRTRHHRVFDQTQTHLVRQAVTFAGVHFTVRQHAVLPTRIPAPRTRHDVVDITFATRENDSLYLGSSPRGSLGLFRTGQAYAAAHGRDYVLPDDIKALAEAVLAHRVLVNPAARLRQVTPRRVIADLLQRVPMPDADLSRR